MDIRISKKIKVGKKSKPLIIAEVSANHCGSKKIFLKHIIAANKSGADLVKIQTYEPDDMLVTKKFVIKKDCGKIEIFGNFISKQKHHMIGIMMLLK